jgi:outer membrane lipoprotein-sorting protein
MLGAYCACLRFRCARTKRTLALRFSTGINIRLSLTQTWLRHLSLPFVANAGKNGGMKKLFLGLFLVLSVLCSPSSWAVTPATLTPQDRADIARVEAYLNGLQRLSASIMQINPDGSVIGGVLKIQRPGKLRLDYDAPNRSMLIADGSFVHYYDAPLNETSSVPQGGSPADLVLAAQIDFSRNMTVTNIARSKAVLEVAMVKNDDVGNGELTLVFDDSVGALKLRQWKVRDAQNTVTTVALQNIDTTATFAADTFVYSPPRKKR